MIFSAFWSYEYVYTHIHDKYINYSKLIAELDSEQFINNVFTFPKSPLESKCVVDQSIEAGQTPLLMAILVANTITEMSSAYIPNGPS